MLDKQILIFRIKPSRIKAREIALQEVRFFLGNIDKMELVNAEVVIGGPLSTEKGILAAYISENVDLNTLVLNADTDALRLNSNDTDINVFKLNFQKLNSRQLNFQKLGYIEKVELLKLLPNPNNNAIKNKNIIKWKGQFYKLDTIYEGDKEVVRNHAPDKRPFLLPDSAGKLRYVNGYRGDGTDTGRRALPVEDSKMMLNISNIKFGQKVLDPFAGAGGIVFAAKQFELDVYSSDIDPILQYGLRDYGSTHFVASVENLPFDSNFFDAVVTEIPFDENVTPIVAKGLEEIVRVTTAIASIVMMTSENQADPMREKAITLNLESYIDQSLNRKGTPVHIFGWRKNSKIE